MTKYNFNPNEYEPKWRKQWETEKVYEVDNPKYKSKPKYYCLDMFPYPSGDGLHVGHWRGYVLSDVLVRYKMLKGYNVLHPMGWDNFGLPAENDAIKRGIHPKESTKKNIDNMRRQLKEIGCAYDWSKEISTTNPEYYKWTQYIFLKMFERGLAYRQNQPVNWCNNCAVVLANEEVAGGKCERCGGSNIKKKQIKQWMLKITDYAEELLNDLDILDWPEKVKEMQKNWIGKSDGASIDFFINDSKKQIITVFTTKPHTLFGATFIGIAPENPILSSIVTHEYKKKVNDYLESIKITSDIDRQKDKTGIFTGSFAINPANNKSIPIWISNYVLIDYGTGAIMGVPAHDERDFEFAKKYDIQINDVISSEKIIRNRNKKLTCGYTEEGFIVNSDFLNGLNTEDAKKHIVTWLEENKKGKKTISYKLRDWIFARQRYWGEPIPIVYCKKCCAVPVPYSQLPVKLPDVKSYKPTNDGSSPLANIKDWVNTTCPKCKLPAKRETDTMPQWAGSSWYYLRYPDRDNKFEIVSKKSLDEWLPVDMYVGGIEHAVLHLLYARFWTKVLYDEKLLPFKEPFSKLFNQGMIIRKSFRCLTCDRWIYESELDSNTDSKKCPKCQSKLSITLEKMSKSKGNGISPDSIVSKYGTDALRLYELFIGDHLLDSEWNGDGIKSCYNFLKKSWHFI
ncbi:MAG: leucine--tRNA ligase, partial [Firmicutes bacterium]|nr:leucine--tRNA ligase [Bacillota bacterium]